MVQINNKEVIQGLTNTANIQIAAERTPNQLADKIVPVMEVNPRLLKITNIIKSRTSGGTGAVYTTPTDKDFYLTSFIISGFESGAVLTENNLTVTPRGESALVIASIQLAAPTSSDNITFTLAHPLLLARGSALTSVINMDVGIVTIMGYTEDIYKG